MTSKALLFAVAIFLAITIVRAENRASLKSARAAGNQSAAPVATPTAG